MSIRYAEKFYPVLGKHQSRGHPNEENVKKKVSKKTGGGKRKQTAAPERTPREFQ